jgi:hypothetical protein
MVKLVDPSGGRLGLAADDPGRSAKPNLFVFGGTFRAMLFTRSAIEEHHLWNRLLRCARAVCPDDRRRL